MRLHLCILMLALTLFVGISVAAAQTAQKSASIGDFIAALNNLQWSNISPGVQNQPAQTFPEGTQAQVGKKLPDPINLKALPPQILAVIAEACDVLYVRLDDRVVLIDPENQVVAQILMDKDFLPGASTAQK
jgi:hypothetical protein